MNRYGLQFRLIIQLHCYIIHNVSHNPTHNRNAVLVNQLYIELFKCLYLESNGRRWEQLASLCKLNTHQTAHFEIFSKCIKSVNYKIKTSKPNEILFVILKITELYVITIFAKQIKSTKNPERHSWNIYKVTRYSSQVLKISINAPYRISPLRNLFEKAITGIDGFTFQLVAMFALCTYLS